MKTKFLPIIISLFALIFFVNGSYCQAPDFGSLSNFALFTTAGAVGNTGISQITGNIGTNIGAITGFGAPSTVSGTIYNNDAVTVQAITDLEAAYVQLSSFVVTNNSHAPAFGTGETLFPGVYSIAGASSVAGTLTLDAQGDPNALFIFKIGGAFTTGASATIILTNQASASNVFWVAEGAISMATLTMMKGTLIAHPGAASMGAGCHLEGRLFSTTGAISVYGVTTFISHLTTTWTGASGTSDWFTAGNWTKGVPGATIEAYIPSPLLDGRFFPIINTGTAIVDSIFIQPDASLVVSFSTLQIKGAIINNGILNAANGSVDMSGYFSQTIAENTFQDNALNNLIISNTGIGAVILGGSLDIYGSLSCSGIGIQFVTHDLLTLKSTALNTARVADMTGNLIIGKVTVERYLSAQKGWRFLSIPTNTSQTVKECWQEGATATGSDPIHGYGTQITSNRASWLSEGFDLYSSNGPSMKTYNSSTGEWIGIENTNVSNVKTKEGYMIFIRGDRTANAYNSIPTETILRTTGELYTGDQAPVLIEPNMFASIGNPYASAIDMRHITKIGLKDFFYVWDPYLVGSSGNGGYQTFYYNGSDYEVTPGLGSYGPEGSIYNYIQSGQAFFIQSGPAGGSLIFKEDAKIDISVAKFAGL